MRTDGGSVWWWVGGAVVSLAGATLLARQSIGEQRALFETDARIVHRLLSQQVVQHDAILDTLALLQPGPEAPGATPPEQRLPALYPHILSVQRRDRGGDWPDPALAAKGEYECITDEAALASWVQRLREAPLVSFDTETDSLDPMRANLVGLSFAVEAGKACYIPVGHDYPGAPAQLPLAQVLDALRPVLQEMITVLSGVTPRLTNSSRRASASARRRCPDQAQRIGVDEVETVG